MKGTLTCPESQTIRDGAKRPLAGHSAQFVSRLRRVILEECGRRSVGGDLFLDVPLFYGQATPEVHVV